MGKIIYKPEVEDKAPETTAPESTAAVQTMSCACAAKQAHYSDCFDSILHNNVQTARFERNAWFIWMLVAVLMLIVYLRKVIA